MQIFLPCFYLELSSGKWFQTEVHSSINPDIEGVNQKNDAQALQNALLSRNPALQWFEAGKSALVAMHK
jgi:hypothetical protein